MLTRYQQKFYYAYVCCMLLIFSPFNGLAYLSPFVFLLFLISEKETNLSLYFIKRLSWFMIVIWSLFFLYKNIYTVFNPPSFWLSCITYSSFYPLLFIQFDKLKSELLLDKIAKFSRSVFFIEGCIGVTQAVYGFSQTGSFDTSNGDFVEGTIHLPLNSELSFSNPMFSANMISLAVFLIIYYLRKGSFSKGFLLLPGLFSIILASVLHQIALLIGSFILALFLIPNVKFGEINWNYIKKYIIYGVVILLVPISILLRHNLNGLIEIPKEIITNDSKNIPKAIVTAHALFDLPRDEPASVFFGLGPGQFSSRAALIMSGYYFGGPSNPKTLPFIDSNVNELADKYVISTLIRFHNVAYFGSSFYSILSVYTEFGLIGILFVIIWIVIQILRGRRCIVQSKSRSTIFSVLGVFILILFVFFLGVQVNYYEVVQAIFLSVLITILLKSQYKY